MNNLADNLKSARTARGLTQDQVAQAIGLARPTYALIESGKRDVTLSQAETLAALLRISVDELRGVGIPVFNTETSMEKYKQMILNALEAGADKDGKITKTKLAKLVYLADFTWYYNHLVPMSGMSYRRLPQGPVPETYFRAVDELVESGVLCLEEKGRAFMLSMAESGAAPSSKLSPEERQMIRKISESWQGKQTHEIVNFTHEQLPWSICREGEVIPYGLITQEDPEKVWNEITRRLRAEERSRDVFDRVHISPESSADIPDLEDVRLVIAHPRHSWCKQESRESEAYRWVHDAVGAKGASQRIHRNTVVFLLADRNQLEGLEAATRTYLGWKQVQATSESLNLSVQQRKQADEQVGNFDRVVADRIRGTFIWTVYPVQPEPTQPFELMAEKVPDSGGRSLAERVSHKMQRDDLLVTEFGAAILGSTLREELGTRWRETGEISVGELWGYFTRYIYMHRLVKREVLDAAIERALTTILVENERFGIAAGKDPETGRYRGLVLPPDPNATIQVTDSTLLVDSARAQEQLDADRAARETAPPAAADSQSVGGHVDVVRVAPGIGEADRAGVDEVVKTVAARFFGSVKIDPELYSRDIGNITREIIDRLAGAGARLEITIDIQAVKTEGFNDTEIRTISENARVLKFDPSSGFEKS